jgi:hypothetical protein
MGIFAIVLAFLSIICAALGLVNVLEISAEPLISVKLTWTFWMALAGFLMLGTIACLLIGNGKKKDTLE